MEERCWFCWCVDDDDATNDANGEPGTESKPSARRTMRIASVRVKELAYVGDDDDAIS